MIRRAWRQNHHFHMYRRLRCVHESLARCFLRLFLVDSSDMRSSCCLLVPSMPLFLLFPDISIKSLWSTSRRIEATHMHVRREVSPGTRVDFNRHSLSFFETEKSQNWIVPDDVEVTINGGRVPTRASNKREKRWKLLLSLYEYTSQNVYTSFARCHKKTSNILFPNKDSKECQ